MLDVKYQQVRIYRKNLDTVILNVIYENSNVYIANDNSMTSCEQVCMLNETDTLM